MNMTELLIIEDRFFYERVGLTITWRERLNRNITPAAYLCFG